VIDGLIGKAKDLIAALMPQWVRPASGPVTSEYGLRNGAFHAGIDIGTAGPTVAAAAGTVTSTGWNILGGRTGIGIILEHGNGYRTYYGHNPEGGVQVKSGQSVTAGQHIGYGGNTGNSTGNHLHFEVHKNGSTINPRNIGVFDTGGTLKPRGVAVNLSNADERVLTDQQWQAISALAARGAGGVGASLPSHVTLVDEQGGFIARTRVEAREVIAVEMAGASRHKRARGAA
jgi:murein DD-endopeptidase MepM/ murein hydrolase activator NlpD